MDLMKFFEIALRLKEVERQGWIERGVKKPETSSDHSFIVALIVLTLGKNRKLDMEKTLKMAIIHDLPEVIVGDIISKDNWTGGGQMWEKDKVKLERKAMKKLASLSENPKILEVWEEFEAQKTPESRFVKDVDRLATILQAIEYHRKGNYRKPLHPFWNEKGLSSVRDPELRKILDSFLESFHC